MIVIVDNSDIKLNMFSAGTKIICQARGVPLPNITWTKSNGEPIGTVPGLRQVNNLFS